MRTESASRTRVAGALIVAVAGMAAAMGRSLVSAALVGPDEFAFIARAQLVAATVVALGILGYAGELQRLLPALYAASKVDDAVRRVEQASVLAVAVAVAAGATVLAVSPDSVGTPSVIAGAALGAFQQVQNVIFADFRSKGRVERFAAVLFRRNGVVLIATGLTAYFVRSGAVVLAAELAVTAVLVLGDLRRLMSGVHGVAARDIVSLTADIPVPWRASLGLGGASLALFALQNSDRWLASAFGADVEFARYSVVAIPLLVGSSVQALAAGFLLPPFVRQVHAGDIGGVVRRAFGFSFFSFIALTAIGTAGAAALPWALARYLPDYVVPWRAALMIAFATTIRASDFVSTCVVALRRDRMLLVLRTGILATAAVVGWFSRQQWWSPTIDVWAAVALAGSLLQVGASVACVSGAKGAGDTAR